MSTPSPRMVQAELSRCVTRMLLEEPFFGHLLSGVIRRVTTAIPSSAGVAIRDGKVELAVNPEFFLREVRKRWSSPTTPPTACGCM